MHFWIQRHFSAHLNGELDITAAKRVHAHLDSCEDCRATYNNISEGAQFADRFEHTTSPATKELWSRINRQLEHDIRGRAANTLGNMITSSRQWAGSLVLIIRRPAIIGAFAILLAANFVVNYRVLNRPPDVVSAALGHFAFDYSMYLDAITKDEQPTEFYEVYRSSSVEYISASEQISFELASLGNLAQHYQISDTKLLKTSCCKSVQCSLSDGINTVVVFQQPQEHPSTFGGYRLKRTLINDRWFHVAQAGKYQVVSWVTQSSKIVLVGENVFEDLPNLVRIIEAI